MPKYKTHYKFLNMKMLLFFFGLLFISCSTLSSQTVTMQVKDHKVPCTGVAPMECLQVKEANDKDWKFFYASIEGFDYQEGYNYTLKVEKSKRDKVPADASAFTYKLKKILKKEKSQNVIEKSNFLNEKMILTKLKGESITTAKVYLTMNNGKLYGKSGCNNFKANYKLENNTIEVSLLGGTLMACDSDAMKLESNFLKALEQKTFKVEEVNGIVTFRNPQTNTSVMEFKIPTQNDIWSFIDGKKWKLIMLDNVAKDYGNAFIQFSKIDKKVFGNTGCNGFGGTYEAKNESIKFSPLAVTEMACLEDNKMETEATLLKYFSDANLSFDVADQTLNFYKDNRLIIMFGIYQE